MGKKAFKYFIILLIIPLIISLVIAISSGRATNTSYNYDSISGNMYESNYTYEEQVKRSNPYIYLTLFTFIAISVGVWAYVRKKGNI